MLTLTEAASRPENVVGRETLQLAPYVAEIPAAMLIAADYEENFYRFGNLPEQLGRLFVPINPQRIDEDQLEDLCEQAQHLLRTSYLTDDAVQIFYRALGNAGLSSGMVHLRRPDALYAETAQVTPPGTAALHALKRLWAQDWTFEAVLERLDTHGNVGLEARPTLVFAGPAGQPDPALAERLSLGHKKALSNALGLVGIVGG